MTEGDAIQTIWCATEADAIALNKKWKATCATGILALARQRMEKGPDLEPVWIGYRNGLSSRLFYNATEARAWVAEKEAMP